MSAHQSEDDVSPPFYPADMVRWLVLRLHEALDIVPSGRWRRRIARALLALTLLFPTTILTIERKRVEAQLRPVVAVLLNALNHARVPAHPGTPPTVHSGPERR